MPARWAITPRIVPVEEITAASALESLSANIAAIAGPALAGIGIALVGVPQMFVVVVLLYLRSLAAVDEPLGRACAAVWWSGGDEAVERAVLPHVEAVIAFGGEAALRSLAGRLPPNVRFQPHGHRIGFGIVGRERLTHRDLLSVAEGAAR